MFVTGRSNVASPKFRKKAQLQFPELFLEQTDLDALLNDARALVLGRISTER